MAFTYNDPVIFAEYAIDTAVACHDVGVRTVAVTAGYINEEPRAEFFRHMDAANVDLKGFTDGVLPPDLRRRAEIGPGDARVPQDPETDVWLEITTLVIPGHNDSESELDALTRWVVETCGPDVPMHFSAFHPDWKMRDVPPTPPSTLSRARDIALANGARYAYTGNVQDRVGDTTRCPGCGRPVIERNWYEIDAYRLSDDGRCMGCGTQVPGVFEGPVGSWGRKRLPVRLAEVTR